MQEKIEQYYFRDAKQYLAESDKAWNAIHRALSGGHLGWIGGDYPLNHTILGGKSLYSCGGYILSLKTPEQVRDIAAALLAIDRMQFKRFYEQIDALSDNSGLCETDFESTWEWFQGIRELFVRAAAENRFVLFSADR